MFVSLRKLYSHPRSWVLFLFFALGISSVFSLVSAYDAHAEYKWVNATTIVETPQTSQNGFDPIRYFSIDTTKGNSPLSFGSGEVISGNDAKYITNPVDGFCSYHIVIPLMSTQSSNATSLPASLVTNRRISGACDKKDTGNNITISNALTNGEVHLYSSGSSIKSVQPNKASTEFSQLHLADSTVSQINAIKYGDKLDKSFSLLVNKNDQIYYQSKPESAECPALLVRAGGSGNWGFITGSKNGSGNRESDHSSTMYRAILSAAGFPDSYGSCVVNDSNTTRVAQEKALGSLIYGDSDYWKNTYRPCNNTGANNYIGFHEIHDNAVFCLGPNVVGAIVNAPFITDPGAIPDASVPDGAPQEPTSSCAIPGVGWLVCPVLGFVSNITDAIYKLISGWLTVDVSLFSVTGKDGNETGTYRGWSAMRNIANIGFVIMFLIVIFSQLTGTGISNYGIKKTLPRLIIMAVLINLSFLITQLMVDVSNIVGSSITTFFSSTAVFGSQEGFLANGNTFSDIGLTLMSGGAVALGAGAAAAGVGFYGGIGLFIVIILGAILAVLVTMLILAARQALIVILIVLAPLAFLAILFPNTKKWFDNWRKIFISLLVIYPMIGIVFGASAMAASILVQENAILGLAVATIPLFAVIPMLKGSLNAVPIAGNLASKFAKRASLGGNIKGGVKQARKNAMGDMRSKALGVKGDGRARRATRWLAGGQARGRARDNRFGSNINRDEAQYIAQQTKDNPNATPRELAAATAALHKIQEEEISAAQELQKGMLFKDIKDIAGTGLDKNGKAVTEIQRHAAIRYMMDNGNFKDRRELVESTTAMTQDQRQSVSRGVLAKGDQKIYGASIADAILEGKVNETSLKAYTADTIRIGKVDATTVARDAGSAGYLASVASDATVASVDPQGPRGFTDDQRFLLAEAARVATTNSELSRTISPEHRAEIEKLRLPR